MYLKNTGINKNKGDKMNKELIKEYANTDYPDNKSMNDYVKKGLFDVVQLSNGMLCGIGKQHINTRFCFRDEGPDYEFYKHLKENNDKMKQYFIQENIKTLDELVMTFQKLDEEKIPCVYDYENGLCNPSWRYWHDKDNNHIDLSDEDRELILNMLRELHKVFYKRLETWWKKYGAEKLHTWTYWADA